MPSDSTALGRVAALRRCAIYCLFVFTSLVPLLLFAYLGQFSRFLSDDYMTTFIGNKLGPIGGMVYWYNNWAGGYSQRFLESLIAPLDIVAVRIMPMLILSFWLVGLVWIVHQSLAVIHVRKHATSISIGVSALLLAAIVNAYYSPQNLYWFTSSTAYILGLGLFTLYMALGIHVARRPLQGRSFLMALLAIGALCFISAGSAEMHAVAQAIIQTLLLCFVVLQFRSTVRRRLFVIFGTGWLLTVCGLIIQAISPGVALRAAEVEDTYGRPARDLLFLLKETSVEFLSWIQHPEAFAGFVMLTALGCLITSSCYPSQKESNTLRPIRITAIELLIPLAVHLTFLPLLWSHTSVSAMFFGRFSPSYLLVILANLALILGLLLLLWRRDAINSQLRQIDAATPAATTVFLFVLTCAFVLILTHVVDIVDLAHHYLISSALVMLTILGRKQLVAARPLSVWQLGVLAPLLLVVACACLAGLAFVALYGQGYVISRILEPVASLVVISGLIWGAFLGCVFRASARSNLAGNVALNALRLVCVGIVSAVGLGMMLGHAAQIPDFQAFAREWDARHRKIIAMRDAGSSIIEVAPLTYHLGELVGKGPLGTEPATTFAETYYGVDDIIVIHG